MGLSSVSLCVHTYAVRTHRKGRQRIKRSFYSFHSGEIDVQQFKGFVAYETYIEFDAHPLYHSLNGQSIRHFYAAPLQLARSYQQIKVDLKIH